MCDGDEEEEEEEKGLSGEKGSCFQGRHSPSFRLRLKNIPFFLLFNKGILYYAVFYYLSSSSSPY